MSIESLGELAFGELPAIYSQAVADPFLALLSDPDARLIYLIELEPYDPDVMISITGQGSFGTNAFGEYDFSARGGVIGVYLSDDGFVTEPSDSPANTYFYAQVDNPFQMDVSILSGDEFGSSIPSFGSISIINGDGELDALQGYSWRGRNVTVKAGAPDFAYSDFATVFQGITSGLEVDDDRIVITISDPRIRTDQLIAHDLYEGSGGLEGTQDLESTPKPLAYGELKNIEPVLVDPVNLVYQVHDGAISSVDAVRDAGVTLTSAGNVADITAAVVAAGQYKTQISGGYIKLGSTPEGRITADIKGDATGSYVDTVGEIAQRVLTAKLGAASFSASELDGAGFNALNAELTGAAGIYIPEKTSVSSVLDALINPCGAYWTFTRQGLLTVGIIDEPGTETIEIGVDDIDEEGIKVENLIPDAWRISVGYARSWVIQSEDEIAAGATDRSFPREEFRFVSSDNRAVRTQNAQAIERTVLTPLADKADAEALRTRLERIYQGRRRKYRIRVNRLLFRVFVGSMVKVTYPRFDLSQGKNLMVTGVSDDVEMNSSVLELWG